MLPATRHAQPVEVGRARLRGPEVAARRGGEVGPPGGGRAVEVRQLDDLDRLPRRDDDGEARLRSVGGHEVDQRVGVGRRERLPDHGDRRRVQQRGPACPERRQHAAAQVAVQVDAGERDAVGAAGLRPLPRQPGLPDRVELLGHAPARDGRVQHEAAPGLQRGDETLEVVVGLAPARDAEGVGGRAARHRDRVSGAGLQQHPPGVPAQHVVAKPAAALAVGGTRAQAVSPGGVHGGIGSDMKCSGPPRESMTSLDQLIASAVSRGSLGILSPRPSQLVDRTSVARVRFLTIPPATHDSAGRLSASIGNCCWALGVAASSAARSS